MHLAMTPAERGLFEGFLRSARHYVEFGAGGSTTLAAWLVPGSLVSVDSSTEWLDRVRQHCSTRGAPVMPRLVHVDIGPTKEWGYPADEARREDWRGYHERVWAEPEASRADLYLVDGRFRVACFAQVLLHAAPDALIAIHDFANRPDYQVVHQVAREVARAENLSVFLRRQDYDPRRVLAILEEHALVPA